MPFNPLPTNPSPLAAQRLQLMQQAQQMQQPAAPALNPALVKPLMPTNPSPLAAARLAQLGRPASPVQMPQPPNPALQAQRAAIRGLGSFIR